MLISSPGRPRDMACRAPRGGHCSLAPAGRKKSGFWPPPNSFLLVFMGALCSRTGIPKSWTGPKSSLTSRKF